MILVISSPSNSTTGFWTAIFCVMASSVIRSELEITFKLKEINKEKRMVAIGQAGFAGV